MSVSSHETEVVLPRLAIAGEEDAKIHDLGIV
jgi:hypothetical protein